MLSNRLYMESTQQQRQRRQYFTRGQLDPVEQQQQQQPRLASPPPTLDRFHSTRRSILRRSILARDDNEKTDDKQRQSIEIEGTQRIKVSTDGSTVITKGHFPDLWKTFCYVITCCCPPFALRVLGKKDKAAQLAFREKIGLCAIVLGIMAFVGFLTFGFTQTVCPRPPLNFRINQINSGYVIIHGWAYLLASWNDHPAIPGVSSDPTNPVYPPVNAGGLDASFLFQYSTDCSNVLTSKTSSTGSSNVFFPCQMFDPRDSNSVPDSSTYSNHTACHQSAAARAYFESMRKYGVPNNNGGFDKAGRVYYDWDDVEKAPHLAVYNSQVLNLNLLQALPLNEFSIPASGLIDSILRNRASFGGQDLTRTVATHRVPGNRWQQEAKCLTSTIKIGEIDTKSVGCITSDVVLYVSLIVILGVILVKFILAVAFGWFLSWRLGNFKEGASYKERMRRDAEIEHWTSGIYRPAEAIRPQQQAHRQSSHANKTTKRKSLIPRTSRFTQPEPGTTHYTAERPVNAIWRSPPSARMLGQFGSSIKNFGDVSYHSLRRPSDSSRRSSISSTTHSTLTGIISRHAIPQPKPDFMPFGFALAHTICLITCYSEGVDGLRTTLDSIATTDYPNSHKLILVIADGIITGHGNDRSTPDICVSMMQDFLIPPDQVQPQSYIAIADGAKRHNMAKVYAGFYKYDDTTVDPTQQQRVPMITIAKCGPPEEANDRKPGNRGKRDSQVLLMSFLQKVMFDERMTTLEYEFFMNIWRITGVSPDKYEIVLMVDADTKVYPDALSRLISCMVNDPEIAGLCGETKIGNKTDSWVSMIQVFEYYISHHQSKAFESIFGNVTCLPGCFCMYRIKAPKGPNGHWVPILANPDIIEHYSENVVDTLHKKNLLLLGEDRYLSTLMLKTFPRRKMLFVPQAVCKTVVPDSFRVLLSQRRRWINSTIHNLMELLFVSDLCGTFCFSMQFVVFMELVGTLALPAAISFTMYLIILAILGQPAVVSLILLALILGLPAILIVMTSRKVVYVFWMIIYLFSLPIWNFVLPSYAYWHFDDFTWGETRKVAGGDKGHHGDKEGVFDSSRVTMKKWSEYERERKQRAIEEKMLLRSCATQARRSPSSTSILNMDESHYDMELLDTHLPIPRHIQEEGGRSQDWEANVLKSLAEAESQSSKSNNSEADNSSRTSTPL